MNLRPTKTAPRPAPLNSAVRDPFGTLTLLPHSQIDKDIAIVAFPRLSGERFIIEPVTIVHGQTYNLMVALTAEWQSITTSKGRTVEVRAVGNDGEFRFPQTN